MIVLTSCSLSGLGSKTQILVCETISQIKTDNFSNFRRHSMHKQISELKEKKPFVSMSTILFNVDMDTIRLDIMMTLKGP